MSAVASSPPIAPAAGAARDPADYFPASYRVSRERLLAAAHALSPLHDVCVDSRAIAPRGPDGETLALDFVVFGARRPRHVLVVSSGTHGVEGFTGAVTEAAPALEVSSTGPGSPLSITGTSGSKITSSGGVRAERP